MIDYKICFSLNNNIILLMYTYIFIIKKVTSVSIITTQILYLIFVEIILNNNIFYSKRKLTSNSINLYLVIILTIDISNN